MNQPVMKDELLQLFNQTREVVDTFTETSSEADRREQGSPQAWAAKDVLAQIAFWMDYTVDRIGYYQRGEAAPREVDFGALNSQVFEANRLRAWDDVVSEVRRAWEGLYSVVSHATETLLATENRYGDDTGGPLWGEVRANGFIWPLQEIEKLYVRRHAAAQAETIHALLRQLNVEPEPAVVSALIEPTALHSQQASTTSPLIIDVRSAKEYAAGHVQGAVNISLDELPLQLNKFAPERPIVTYCNMHHPGQSRGEKAAALLAEKGFQAAALKGGFPAWKTAELPVQQGSEIRG